MTLGLDELIIVNPGTPPAGSWLLGTDGGIYRIDSDLQDAALGDQEPVPQYFLGEDGVLYEAR